MYSMWFLFVTLIFIGYSQPSCTLSSNELIELGQTSVLCVHFYIANKTYSYAFPIKVDQFSGIIITNFQKIYQNITQNNTQLTLQFQNGNQTQKMTVYLDSLSISRNLFSAVIQVDQGVYNSIVLDNQNCNGCSGKCEKNNCFNQETVYKKTAPRIFISWIGTDKGGNHFLSHTRRLSRFNQYSIGSIYDKARNIF